MRAFSPWFPTKRRKQLERRLKRIRRAAGQARDLDVLFFRLISEKLADDVALRRFFAELRQECQIPLLTLESEGGLRRETKELCARIRWRGKGPEPCYGEWSHAALSRNMKHFAKAASRDLQQLPLLHEMRISGKRLRYALELLTGHARRKDVTSVQTRLVSILERLGTINDHASAAECFVRWRAKTSDKKTVRVLSRVAKREVVLCRKKQDAFLAWWRSKYARDLASHVRSLTR